MSSGSWASWLRRGLTLALTAVLLVFCTASSCGNQGGQYREMGERMGQMKHQGSVPGSMKYVVDISTKQYWPNLPKYADKIKSENRVYVLDDATLAQFKDYRPGPL
jgi:hypothetical protein